MRYYLIPKFFPEILVILERFFLLFCSSGGRGFQASQVVLLGKGQPTLIRWAFVFLDSIEFLLPILPFEFPLEQPSISILWTISLSRQPVFKQWKETRDPPNLVTVPSTFAHDFYRNLSKHFHVVSKSLTATILPIRTSVKLSRPKVSRNIGYGK